MSHAELVARNRLRVDDPHAVPREWWRGVRGFPVRSTAAEEAPQPLEVIVRDPQVPVTVPPEVRESAPRSPRA